MFRNDDVIKNEWGVLKNFFHQNVVGQVLGKVMKLQEDLKRNKKGYLSIISLKILLFD